MYVTHLYDQMIATRCRHEAATKSGETSSLRKIPLATDLTNDIVQQTPSKLKK